MLANNVAAEPLPQSNDEAAAAFFGQEPPRPDKKVD